ncbi:neutral zinc metallopeptidase [Nonomuraea sp. NPDC050783]|uniref:neutral zinc metallopeptidase n=1 Tax=Nonomuraea sp. NPDC050783 TaxID=3154634 RepID=UPI0034676A0D
MKTLQLAALVCALAAPIAGAPAANAAIYPVKDRQLTENPLYAAGPLPATTCGEPRVRRGDRARARAYVNAVLACLEKTWERHLVDAGLGYKKVKVRHMSRIPKKYCGFDVTDEESQAWYCDRNDTFAFQIGKDWLDDPSDLWLFHTTAFMYGYHVQKLVAIDAAYDKLPYQNKSEFYEQSRRKSLQNDCLSAAFLKSVWPMKNRAEEDWYALLDLVQGDRRGEKRWSGRTGTIKNWMRAGFKTGDPASCNTWTAPSSKVA